MVAIVIFLISFYFSGSIVLAALSVLLVSMFFELEG